MYIEQRIEELEKQVGTRSDKEKQELIAFANGKASDPFAVLEKYVGLATFKSRQSTLADVENAQHEEEVAAKKSTSKKAKVQ